MAALKRAVVRLALALPFVGGVWRGSSWPGMFAGMVGVMTPRSPTIDSPVACCHQLSV